MHALTHLFSRTRSKINLWRSEGLTSIDSAILSIEAEILSLEQAEYYDSDASSNLSDLYSKYSDLQSQNASRWAQRSHLNWLLNGDQNTAFFHNMVRVRNHFNSINSVIDSNGSCCSDRNDIEDAFFQFYTNLWTETVDRNPFEIAIDLPYDLPQVTADDGILLTRDVSREEIYFALFNLPLGKSPGPDGFSVEFFRFFWDNIGDQVCSAIKFFFNNSVMPASWGKTFVVLIPKNDNPRSVSDFRPISLCNICFKIIS